MSRWVRLAPRRETRADWWCYSFPGSPWECIPRRFASSCHVRDANAERSKRHSHRGPGEQVWIVGPRPLFMRSCVQMDMMIRLAPRRETRADWWCGSLRHACHRTRLNAGGSGVSPLPVDACDSLGPRARAVRHAGSLGARPRHKASPFCAASGCAELVAVPA